MSNIRPPHILERDDAYLREAWQAGVPSQEIADYLQRPLSYIASRACDLNVRRPAWYIAAISRRPAHPNQKVYAAPYERPTGHRMTEEAIKELYAGQRYESIDAQDNNVGRIHLPQTYVARANVLAGAA